jgi:hypothetical protein
VCVDIFVRLSVDKLYWSSGTDSTRIVISEMTPRSLSKSFLLVLTKTYNFLCKYHSIIDMKT